MNKMERQKANSRIIEGLSETQYNSAIKFISKISPKPECNVYSPYSGGVIKTDVRNGRIEFFDDVAITIVDVIRDMTKKQENRGIPA